MFMTKASNIENAIYEFMKKNPNKAKEGFSFQDLYKETKDFSTQGIRNRVYLMIKNKKLERVINKEKSKKSKRFYVLFRKT